MRVLWKGLYSSLIWIIITEARYISEDDVQPISIVNSGIRCWQCAAKKGSSIKCPKNSKLRFLDDWNACMTWTLESGEVILQNFIDAETDCATSRLQFWERYILEEWKVPGKAKCCYTDGCNNGDEITSLDKVISHDINIYPNPIERIHPVLSSTGDCTAVYRIKGSKKSELKADWIPSETFEMDGGRARDVYAKVFYAKLFPGDDPTDNIIIRLVQDDLDPGRLYTVKLYRGAGRAALFGGTNVLKKTSPIETLLKSSTIFANIRSDEYTGYWIRVFKRKTIQFGRLNVSSPILEWTAELPHLNRIGFTSTSGGLIQLGCSVKSMPPKILPALPKSNFSSVDVDTNSCFNCVGITHSKCAYINSIATCRCKEGYIPLYDFNDRLKSCNVLPLANYIGDPCSSDIDCLAITHSVCFHYRCICKAMFTPSINKEHCDLKNTTLTNPFDITFSFETFSTEKTPTHFSFETFPTEETPTDFSFETFTTAETPTTSLNFEAIEIEETTTEDFHIISDFPRESHSCRNDNDCLYTGFGLCLFPSEEEEGSCSCLQGYLPIYEFNGDGIPILQECNDSFNASIKLGGACLMQNHCFQIPDSACLPSPKSEINTCQCPAGFRPSQDLKSCLGFKSSQDTKLNLNRVSRPSLSYESCKRMTTLIEREEWVPKELIRLEKNTFGMTDTKVVVFFAKLPTTSNNQDGIIVRLLQDESSSSMRYSIYFRKNNRLEIHSGEVSERGANSERERISRNIQRDEWLNDRDFIGYWIAMKKGVIVIGVVGEDTLSSPLLEWVDTEELSIEIIGFTIVNSAIIYGVECPNTRALVAPKVCFKNKECASFLNTECIIPKITQTFEFKTCDCVEGHVPIPRPFTSLHSSLTTPLNGCYDPIVNTKTLNGKCLADSHCKNLPFTGCRLIVPNSEERHCSCLPGSIPLQAQPETGLILGCQIANMFRASMETCAANFRLKSGSSSSYIPPNLYRMQYSEDDSTFSSTFFVDFESGSGELHVILFDKELNDRGVSYRATIDYKGEIRLQRSRYVSGFFFGGSRRNSELARSVLPRKDLSNGFNGFWIRYSLKDKEVNVGLVGSDKPFINWVDRSNGGLDDTEFIGFRARSGTFQVAALCYDS